MIKEHVNVSELRTNNYVLIWGRPIQICGTLVLKHVAKVFTYNGLAILEYGCQEVFPIPLTPEWLERMGFTYSKTFGCYSKDFEILFCTDGNEYWLCEQNGNMLSKIGKPFQYLHQLQNLYFDLTREELQIKL